MKKIILTYHRVGEVVTDYNNTCITKDNFNRQMIQLKKHFLVLPMKEFLQYKGNKAVAAVTFDDGYSSFFYDVLPILEKYEIPVTLFITLHQDNSEFWMSDIMRMTFEGEYKDGYMRLNLCDQQINLSMKDVRDRVVAYNFLRRVFRHNSIANASIILKDLHEQTQIPWKSRKNYRPLSINQIKKISECEYITLGAHTINHFSLGYMNGQAQKKEIIGCIKKLHQISGKDIEYFSYPFGSKNDYNEMTKAILLENGIKAAFTTETRFLGEVEDEFAIPRINCENCDGEEWLHYIKNVLEIDENTEGDVYIGQRSKDKRIELANRIVICGYGHRAEEIYNFLENRKLHDRIVAFVDKNYMKIKETKYDNLRIQSYDDYIGDNSIDWIVQNQYDFEIINFLINKKIKRIHWWID